MTKAEKIFKDTYTQCRVYIKAWGTERNDNGKVVGFTRLDYSDNDFVCMRTINAVEKLLASERKMLAMDIKLGILEPDRIKVLTDALDMVESTIENQKDSLNA